MGNELLAVAKIVQVSFRYLYAGDLDDDVSDLVNRERGGAPKYGRDRVGGLHRLVEGGDAIIDVAESAGLLAVSPNLDVRG